MRLSGSGLRRLLLQHFESHLPFHLGPGPRREDAVDRRDQHLVAHRPGVEKSEVANDFAVAGEDRNPEIPFIACLDGESRADVLRVEADAPFLDNGLARRTRQVILEIIEKGVLGPEGQRPQAARRVIRALGDEGTRNL